MAAPFESSATGLRPSSGRNVGKDVTNTAGSQRGKNATDWELKYYAVVQENERLKVTRNEQEQQLKVLKSKFARLTRDLQRGGKGTLLPNGVTEDDMLDENKSLKDKVTKLTVQRDDARQELENQKRLMRSLRGPNHQDQHVHGGAERRPKANHIGPQNDPHTNSQSDTATQQEMLRLRDQLANAVEELDRASRDREFLRTQLDAVTSHGGAHQHQALAALERSFRLKEENLRNEVMQAQAQHRTDLSLIESLSAERDSLSNEIQLWKAARQLPSSNPPLPTQQQQQQQHQFLSTQPTVQPSTAGTNNLMLQRQLSDQMNQIAILTNRSDQAQQNVSTLRAECERLVGELRTVHQELADAKTATIRLEQERYSLEVKATRTAQLETDVALKATELLRLERELMLTTDKLQSVNRETEMQTRLECNSKIGDLQQSKEQLQRDIRSKERELETALQSCQDLKRKLKQVEEDVDHYRTEARRLADEKQSLEEENARRIVANGSSALSDEALVDAALKGLAEHAHHPPQSNHAPEVSAIARGAEGHEWDARWEIDELRKAALNWSMEKEQADRLLEVQEERLKEKDVLLKDLSTERDVLLDENIDLRRQLTGIHTSFKKREASRSGGERPNTCNLTATVSFVSCEKAALLCEDIDDTKSLTDFFPKVFVSLDGISETYDTAFSDPFPLTPTGMDVCLPFYFADLPTTEALTNSLRVSGRFKLQLHRAVGLGSRLIGIADISCSTLARCVDGAGLAEIRTELLNGEGDVIGALSLKLEIDSLFIPLSLLPSTRAVRERQEVSQPSEAHEIASMRPSPHQVLNQRGISAIIALKQVKGLRVEVTRATGLPSRNGQDPVPYCFYCANDSFGAPLLFVTDTVVHTRTRSASCDPVFDVEAKDHAVTLVDQDFIRNAEDGKLTFVMFDHKSTEPETNIGVAACALAPLLRSPKATLVEELALHPQGTVHVTLSWVL